MRKIGVITVVVDGVRQNIKKGMVKNDQIKSQKKRNHKYSKEGDKYMDKITEKIEFQAMPYAENQLIIDGRSYDVAVVFGSLKSNCESVSDKLKYLLNGKKAS